MTSILFLLFLAVIVWFWIDSVRVKEKAMLASAIACQEIQAQFLDQTASLKSIKVSRDKHGRMVFQRIYNFDFSYDREQRHQGRVTMTGLKVREIQLDNGEGTTIL
ncbi:MAG TPA: DUF3301 domain-containing protein [Leucothrix mucor]|nr:DUF3301 domain-containing protein [Leucothrix mucor]